MHSANMSYIHDAFHAMICSSNTFETSLGRIISVQEEIEFSVSRSSCTFIGSAQLPLPSLTWARLSNVLILCMRTVLCIPRDVTVFDRYHCLATPFLIAPRCSLRSASPQASTPSCSSSASTASTSAIRGVDVRQPSSAFDCGLLLQPLIG